MKNRREVRIFSPSMIVVPLVGALVLFIAGNAWAVEKVHWAMDDGSGNNVADSAGSNDGTISGSGVSWNGFGSGLPGGGTDSLHFSGGLTAQVQHPNDPAFNVGSNSFTLSMDIRGTPTVDEWNYLFNRGLHKRYELYFALNTLTGIESFYVELDAHDGGVNDGKTDLIVNENLILTGSWVHLDVVVDRDDTGVGPHGSLSLYVDNGLVAQEPMTSSGSLDDSTADGAFTIGSAWTPFLDSWNGDIANVVLDVGPIVSVLPGDFDADNDVDGVDFGLWQTGYPTASGATLGDGDADGDGDVDGVDFGLWQANYPTNVGGSAMIPEPATLALLLIGGVALLIRKRQ